MFGVDGMGAQFINFPEIIANYGSLKRIACQAKNARPKGGPLRLIGMQVAASVRRGEGPARSEHSWFWQGGYVVIGLFLHAGANSRSPRVSRNDTDFGVT